jgi:hypothetical protein
MTFFMKVFSKVELRPGFPGPNYPLLLSQHTRPPHDGHVCSEMKIYRETGKSMVANYFFRLRINMAAIPFITPSFGHRRIAMKKLKLVR